MAMIEQGVASDPFRTPKLPRQPRERKPNGTIKFLLKIGMFMIGLGLGFVMAVWMDDLFTIDQIELFILGTVFIFGGLGMISGFFIGRQLDKEQV